ncbi:hypothetical protein [Mangrovicoccus sp. HB161399]|uniref:hypothetical protein n=1 Tax=Mangrovicoccus sp. HB161399 TaxID=2720392 RepID=UPI0015557446|nr:hypothetical protein [Mangrovicoccus sp. HB161399]
MKGNAPISRIYSMGQAAADPDPLATNARTERMRRDSWREHKLVIVRMSELPEPLRAAMAKWAETQWGRGS